MSEQFDETALQLLQASIVDGVVTVIGNRHQSDLEEEMSELACRWD
jgi:hypothetical protein